MNELIKLLNQGWRVKHGFVVGEEKFVKLTKRVFTDSESGEMFFPTAWIIEDGAGNVEVIKYNA